MESIIKILLLPLTLIYSAVVRLRNFLFDVGVLPTKSYSFPLISIGNLSVGGTGKTPHTEYIIKILQTKHALATLSRGYGRKTKGFKIADSSDDASSIGDEPFQIFKKFPEIIVAVDENRKRGIQKMMELPAPPNVILLDDAYQHRFVKPGHNILLTEYSKLYIDDLPLPSGRLRENKSSAKRADVIVVTKSPPVLSPLEIRRITSTLNPKPYQKVYFSFIKYRNLVPVNEAAVSIEDEKNKLGKHGVLLVSAIANPKPMLLHLKRYAKEIENINFRDHHFFNKKDYQKINKRLDDFLSPKKLIVISEKDAVKFDGSVFSDIPVFCLPISIGFHEKEEETFENEIKEYVRSYRTNS